MVNEEKVRMMTKLTIYEEKKGKDMFPIGNYYRGDYIAKTMIVNFFLGTIAFVLLGLIVVGYQMDGLIDNLISLDVASIAMLIAVAYGIFLVVYLGVTYVVTSYRYKKNKRSLKAYEKALKTLDEQFSKEESDTRELF